VLNDCQSKHRAETSSNSGYLASYKSSSSVGIGTPSCPWYIRVGQGQKVNLTLFNFISPTVAGSSESGVKVADTCYHVGVVRDGPRRRHSVTACSSQPRQRTVLVSTSNSVSFEFAVRGLNVRPTHHQAQFLIHYDGLSTFPVSFLPRDAML